MVRLNASQADLEIIPELRQDVRPGGGPKGAACNQNPACRRMTYLFA